MTEDKPDQVRAWAWTPEPVERRTDDSGDNPEGEVSSENRLSAEYGPTRRGELYPGLLGIRTDAIPPGRSDTGSGVPPGYGASVPGVGPSWQPPAEPQPHDRALVTGYPASQSEPEEADPVQPPTFVDPPPTTFADPPPTFTDPPPATFADPRPTFTDPPPAPFADPSPATFADPSPTFADPSKTAVVPAAPSPPVLPPAPPAPFAGAAYPPMTYDEASRGYRDQPDQDPDHRDQADRSRDYAAGYEPGHSAPIPTERTASPLNAAPSPSIASPLNPPSPLNAPPSTLNAPPSTLNAPSPEDPAAADESAYPTTQYSAWGSDAPIELPSGYPAYPTPPVYPLASATYAGAGPDAYQQPREPVHPPTPQPPIIPARLPRPEALLLPEEPAVSQQPAEWGWRGRMRRLTGGLIKPRPTPDELAARRALVDIRRTFSRPMTIVVIQPKGGAGKTPTTIGLASALGAHRGGYVVGWDDNETRGTLAVRVSNASGQKTTVWDLLGALPMFERTDARVGELSHFVRPQGEAQFDALVSDDNPANMAQIGEDEFHRLHAVLQRFYRQIVIDTGNNVRSPNWQAAVNAADLVVVVSTYQRDVGYSGSWVLDHLTETGREPLARGAVTVLTAADPTPDTRVRSELLEHFTARTAAVVEIPYDPLIAVGGPMDWSKLKPQTRRAWTSAGAAVVSALAAKDERDRLATR